MAGIAALSVASSLPLPGTALMTYTLVIMHQPVSFSHKSQCSLLNGSRVCGHNWLLPHPPLPQTVWSVLVIFFLLLSEQKLNSLKALCCWTITQSSNRTTHHTPSDPFCSTFVSLLLPHTYLQPESFQRHSFCLPRLTQLMCTHLSDFPIGHPFLGKILP